MSFTFFAVRDYLTITGEPFRARFCSTDKDLNSISNTDLLATEVNSIPRITLEGTYSTNQVTLVKTLSFRPITVQSNTLSSFNTIVVTAGPSIIAKHQFDTYIQIRENTPAIISLGNINIGFE